MSTKSLIREENLEYIAREIGDRYSGIPLSEKLEKIGVPANEIGYPNTKWRMVFDSMVYCNALDENVAIKLLGKIVELGNLTNLKILNLKGNDYSKTDLALIREKLSVSTVIEID